MKIINTIETAKGKLLYTIFSESAGDIEHFGIAVSSKIFGDEETAAVGKVTTDLVFAEKIAFLLADNFVLPSTLSEVIEECICAEFTV